LFETLNTKRKVSYWYGARSKAELYYHGYFEQLQQQHENFSFHVAFSEPENGESRDGHVGFIHNVLYREYLQHHPNLKELEYYLCGPPAMIKAGLEMLQNMGVSKELIAYDEF
jgi:Na+-transporting NADH:ubiquinone oxidoreductase subunit F